jgi:hypothetical protein
MKRISKLSSLIALLALILVVGTADTFAQKKKPVIKKKPAATPVYTVTSGTTMRVRMNNTITSKTARVGDTFTATVTEPVYSSTGVVVIPTGSTVVGRVDAVTAARKGGNVGSIDASFTSVKLPNGKSRAINGSLSDLDSKSAKSDNEGTASGDKTKHRKLIFIGGGGAGGAILGGAVGGGKGALIGGIIGGVGGLIAETQTKGEEATVKSGTEFGVYLNQSIKLPRFVEATPTP